MGAIFFECIHFRQEFYGPQARLAAIQGRLVHLGARNEFVGVPIGHHRADRTGPEAGICG